MWFICILKPQQTCQHVHQVSFTVRITIISDIPLPWHHSLYHKLSRNGKYSNTKTFIHFKGKNRSLYNKRKHCQHNGVTSEKCISKPRRHFHWYICFSLFCFKLHLNSSCSKIIFGMLCPIINHVQFKPNQISGF